MFNALIKKGKTPQEAKEFTNLLMPDYTRYMPPAIRWAKNWGIAPFIIWTYYVSPTMLKLIKIFNVKIYLFGFGFIHSIGWMCLNMNVKN